MATIGLSKPFYAVYSESSGTVSYGSGGVLGKYTALQLQLESASENILYARRRAIPASPAARSP